MIFFEQLCCGVVPNDVQRHRVDADLLGAHAGVLIGPGAWHRCFDEKQALRVQVTRRIMEAINLLVLGEEIRNRVVDQIDE